MLACTNLPRGPPVGEDQLRSIHTLVVEKVVHDRFQSSRISGDGAPGSLESHLRFLQHEDFFRLYSRATTFHLDPHGNIVVPPGARLAVRSSTILPCQEVKRHVVAYLGLQV